MKKVWLVFVLSLTVLVTLCACGNTTSREAQTYTNHTVDEISFELPSTWSINYEGSGKYEVDMGTDKAILSINLIDYAAEGLNNFLKHDCTDMQEEFLKSMGVESIVYNRNTYGKYDSYDFSGEKVSGEKGTVKISSIKINENKAIRFFFISADAEYISEYRHILNSIK